MFEIEQYGPVRALHQGRPFPGKKTSLMSVRCFAIDDVLIDTGIAPMGRHVRAYTQERGLRRVWLTHHHEDHSGNSQLLQSCGLQVCGNPLTRDLMDKGFRLYPYQHLMWGRSPRVTIDLLPRQLETANYRFTCHSAPGHCRDLVVFHEAQQGWLFSGDAFLASRVKYFRGDEDFHQTVASLKQLAQLDFDQLFCAHRPIVKTGHQALKQKLEHLLDVEQRVRQLHKQGYPKPVITKKVLGKEDTTMFLLTLGDVSKRNMVRSILSGPKPRKD